jgi:hypothetical protein
METVRRGIAARSMAETPTFADGGVVSPFTIRGVLNSAKKLLEPESETMTSKYARQDAAFIAKHPKYFPSGKVPVTQTEDQKAITQYASGNRLDERMKSQGLKDGGPVKAGIIRGPGTGTSDSIKGTMQPGSFVMPKDSTDVMVSNGETHFTPEMVQSIGAAALMAVKDLTHTPVAKQVPNGKAQHFFSGGVVEDEKPPMSYGEQMKNLGNAVVNAPVTALKTVVSAPGYGFNTEPQAAPQQVTQPSTPQAPQLGISQAGAGRGFVNQALVNPSAPSPASPLTKVDLGNGITKTTGGSSPLYSNVGDADNAALMGRGKVSAQNQLAINGIQSRQNTADAATQQRLQYQSEVDDATKFREGVYQGGIQRRALNGNRNALALLQGQTNDATARRGQDITAAGQTATNQNAAARLGIDRTNANLSNQLTTQQIGATKQMQDLQTRLLTAKPDERAVIEDNLRALQGKYEKPVADRFTVVPGGTDDLGNKQASRVLNNQTGQFVDAPQTKPAFEAGKTYTDAKGNRATWNGQSFVPVK